MNARPTTDDYTRVVVTIAIRLGERADDTLREAVGVGHNSSELWHRISGMSTARRATLYRELKREEVRNGA